MSRKLPSLSTIRVFEAVARKLSFTRAADELGMTQAAVSYQIKLLEGQVGRQLFLRQPRGAVLTEAGQRIAPLVTDAFDLLQDAFADELQQEQETLNVSTTNGFSALWLVPRLADFHRVHPWLVVKVETTDRTVDFSAEAVDVAIRAGNGDWPGLVTKKVMDVHFAPMLSPKLANRLGDMVAPGDLLRFPLIDPGNSWWQSWFDAHNLPTETLRMQATPSMGTQIYSLSAALDGQGVALLTPAYHRRALNEGSLVQPFPELQAKDWSYWLAYPENRRRSKKVKAFEDWLLKAET